LIRRIDKVMKFTEKRFKVIKNKINMQGFYLYQIKLKYYYVAMPLFSPLPIPIE